jgi:hypothetical protein
VEIKRLPTNLAKALELALASAGDPAPSTEAVALLVTTVDKVNNAGGVKRGWLREAWTANHPALIQAMDGAVQQVLAGTREDDKVQVWCALARSGDKPAVEALAERILDGRVPNQTPVLALIAASKNRLFRRIRGSMAGSSSRTSGIHRRSQSFRRLATCACRLRGPRPRPSWASWAEGGVARRGQGRESAE